MNKNFVIHWRSKSNGRVGTGTTRFDREEGEQLAAAHQAVAKVIEVDDFPPEALSPIYKKPAEVHQFFQELGETRAAS